MAARKKKSISVFKIGFLLMLLSIAVLIFVLALNYFKYMSAKGNGNNIDDAKLQEESTSLSQEDKNLWTPYINRKYSIAFSYPYLLHKRESENTGDYELFIVFEENQFSKEKGVAFGVNKDGLVKETGRIKEDVSKQGKSKIIKDEKLNVDNGDAWILEIEPEEEDLEKRTFLVIEEGDYTYSFSTVPEQMQKLSESIQFLD